MSEWIIIFGVTLAAGLAMVVGAMIASIEHISNRWLENELRHTVVAFGGGLLLSAVSLVLVHEGMHNLSIMMTILSFGLGGLVFMFLDRILQKKKEQMSQFFAMFLDFIPEVIVLGAIYLLNKPYALLLALLIVLQNLPEGFNAYLEIRSKGRHKGKKIISTFLWMSLLGPIAGLSGYFFLSESQALISAVMLFASGGILYLVFQDIAPMSKLRNHQAPTFGAVIGFLFGMVGKMVIMRFI